MTLNGLVTVSITTIEKRFHLTSSQSGLFSSMYDIGVLVTLLPVCHFGGKGHKGRWIAAGMFLLGLGSLVCTIPHLAGEAYVYGQGKRSGLCQPDVLNLSTPRSHSNHGKESYAYPLLLTGQFLHGTGAAPLYTLGVSYLDESVSQKMSPVYLGLFLSSATVGSAIGFFLGGLLLKINGNIDKSIKASTDVAPGDPSWYGAWWIGFLISSAILFSTTPLLCAFKKELPGAKLYAKERVDQANGMSFGRAIVAGTKQSTTKDLPRLLLALLRNCTFLFIVVKEVLLGFLINGFITFLPKFTETIFLFSASTSSIVSGGAFIPPAILGNVLGGYLIKWLKLRCRQTILLCILCGILCVLLIPSFLLDYQGTPLAGADIFYNYAYAASSSSVRVLLSSYFKFWETTIFSRCVPFEQRTLALGVDYIFARALGTVPGPIAFGSLIDTACNVWMGSGNELSCVWYDSVKFKTILFTLSITFKLASVLALMVAWKMYRPPSGTKDGAHIRWDRIKWFISWRYTGNPYSFDEGNAVLRSYGKTLK
ncbi:sodium-independent organic anion transporter [Trichuris suis]|nr:sodium-independent organic anion transporter [Trichuris suis]